MEIRETERENQGEREEEDSPRSQVFGSLKGVSGREVGAGVSGGGNWGSCTAALTFSLSVLNLKSLHLGGKKIVTHL